LKEIEDQERTNTVKLYLAETINQENIKNPSINSTPQSGFYIPNKLVLKKLYLGSSKERHK